MRYLTRELETQVLQATRNFPAVVVTGPRRAGKTWLLRHLWPKAAYGLRDEQGLEVDFLVPGRSGSVSLVECKAGRTVTPPMAAPMQRLAEALRKKRPSRTEVDLCLVHQPAKGSVPTRAVAPGVRALAWQEFVAEL